MSLLTDLAEWLKLRRQTLGRIERPFRCTRFRDAERARDHVILIDGTGNDSSAAGKETNIWHLARELEALERAGAAVHVRYHSGVGSDEDDENYVQGFLRQVGGKGLTRIVMQACHRLIEDYAPGDRLSILGFSRGAVIATVLANEVADRGIPEAGVLRYYKMTTGDEWLDQIVPTAAVRPVESIRLLGLFDRVAMVGPLEQLFEGRAELGIPAAVDQVVHLVSIDENRTLFPPLLVEPAPNVEELWLPGVHADVGGGYRRRGLAEIALGLMRARLRAAGLPLPVPEASTRPPELYLHVHGPAWPKTVRQVRVLGGGTGAIHPLAHELMAESAGAPPSGPPTLDADGDDPAVRVPPYAPPALAAGR